MCPLCFISSQDVGNGLRDGTLFQGKLRINARGRSTAFVTADGGVLPSDIFLDNEKARNRAQEGDLVRAIRVETLLPGVVKGRHAGYANN